MLQKNLKFSRKIDLKKEGLLENKETFMVDKDSDKIAVVVARYEAYNGNKPIPPGGPVMNRMLTDIKRVTGKHLLVKTFAGQNNKSNDKTSPNVKRPRIEPGA